MGKALGLTTEGQERDEQESWAGDADSPLPVY